VVVGGYAFTAIVGAAIAITAAGTLIWVDRARA
jgi:hypothetical protein